jgi:hypothetical protein
VDNAEYLVTEYLLKHGEALKKDICEYLITPPNDVVKKFNFYFFNDEIVEEFIDELQREVADALHLTYPEVDGIINVPFLERVLGRHYLELD